MLGSHEVERRLIEAGYEYYCFVSWPHTISTDITECARSVGEAIRKRLGESFAAPKVFLDETELTGGDKWERVIREALCKSISMVAICAPIYYHPGHPWCGLEWAAMEKLGRTRLSGRNAQAVIPVMLRKSEPLPRAVSETQFIDVSGLSLLGNRYFNVREFRLKIAEITRRIEEIATELAEKRVKPVPEDFSFPIESAFSDYSDHVDRPRPLPFVG